MFWPFRKDKGFDGKKKVAIDDLPTWLYERTRKDSGESEEKLKEAYDILIHGIKTLKKKKDILDSAELESQDDDEIPEKERNAILGTKDIFISKINSLERAISAPEKIDFFVAKEHARRARTAIEEYRKAISKLIPDIPHFDDEIRGVVESANTIEKAIEEIDSVSSDEHMANIGRVMGEIASLGKLAERKNDYHELLSESEGKYEELKKDKERTLAKIGELKKGAQFREFEALEKEFKELGQKMESHRKLLKSDFTKIAKAAKEFRDLDEEHRELLSQYEASPEDSLIADEELKIIKIIGKMKDIVASGGLEKRKKESILAKLSLIDEIRLQSHSDEKGKMELDRNSLRRRLDGITVRKEIDEQEYRLAHIDEKMARLTRDIRKINAELEKDDLLLLREKVERSVKGLLGKDIRIEIEKKEEEEEGKEDVA